VPRVLPLAALCALLAYSAVSFTPCPRETFGHGVAHPDRAEHAVASPAAGHAGHGSHGADHGAAPESTPTALTASCPCGCEAAPGAVPGSTRLGVGIASVPPPLPVGGESPEPFRAPASLQTAEVGSIDHVPILS